MVYFSDVIQKKVKGWMVFILLLLLTIVAAWAISARGASGG